MPRAAQMQEVVLYITHMVHQSRVLLTKSPEHIPVTMQKLQVQTVLHEAAQYITVQMP